MVGFNNFAGMVKVMCNNLHKNFSVYWSMRRIFQAGIKQRFDAGCEFIDMQPKRTDFLPTE